MNKKTTFFTVLIFMFSFITVSYGGFIPKKASMMPTSTIVSNSAEQMLASGAPVAHKHLTLLQKGKLLVASRLLHPFQHARNSGDATLSVLSFCLALGADVAVYIAILGLIFGGGLGFLGLLIFGAFTAVAAFVLGIMALAKKQRLKGLAIAGIVLSAEFVIEFIAALIALAALI